MNDALLILGKGQIARALKSHAPEARLLSRPACDLSEQTFLAAIQAEHRKSPLQAVLNAAAFTAVDAAETDEKAAMRINAEAPGELARWCAAEGVALVHYSTDYVFDGSGSAPWKESDSPAPLNAYGRSKLAGEQAVLAAGGRALILRTSWVYDSAGKNFFTTMRRLMREKAELSVVSDQFGAPSYAPHVAAASLRALAAAQRGGGFGLYHLCNAGVTSWHGFAQAILEEELGLDSQLTCGRIIPILSANYAAPAKRPLNSRLDCSHISSALDVWMPPWQAGMRECFEVASL